MDLDFVRALKEFGIEQPHLEARWILEKAAGDKAFAIRMLEERCSGVPLAYVLKEKGFFKDIFHVEPGVLIPRPETELLVEKSFEQFKDRISSLKTIYDFGCGSGCIGLSILKESSEFTRLVGFDISEVAIKVSHINATKLGVSDRASFQLLPVEDLLMFVSEKADLVVANPPYIALGDSDVATDVKKYEPHEALYSGDRGLEKIETWSLVAFQALRPGGVLALEFGRGQEDKVRAYLRELGFLNISIYKDLAGISRAAVAQKESSM